jgi:hypothetical protein
MGHYTKFYFRAKLDFRLPEPIRLLFRKACQTYDEDLAMHQRLLRSEVGASAAAMTGRNRPWGGYFHDTWIGHPAHEFFACERAMMIPWGRQGEDYPVPVYVEYPDGSSRLEFTCEFKNYADEIAKFLDWIMPYVRFKYGKRNRGRQRIWVGYAQPESARGRIDYYLIHVPAIEQFTEPGPVVAGYPTVTIAGPGWERAVVDDYQNINYY